MSNAERVRLQDFDVDGHNLPNLVKKWEGMERMFATATDLQKSRASEELIAKYRAQAEVCRDFLTDLRKLAEASQRSETPHAAGGELRGFNEIDLVRKVLAYHQRAYAKFHCTEGRDPIEAEGMAIGETSVEIAKWLAAQTSPAAGEACFTCEGESGQPATRVVAICEQCFGEDAAAEHPQPAPEGEQK